MSFAFPYFIRYITILQIWLVLFVPPNLKGFWENLCLVIWLSPANIDISLYNFLVFLCCILKLDVFPILFRIRYHLLFLVLYFSGNFGPCTYIFVHSLYHVVMCGCFALEISMHSHCGGSFYNMFPGDVSRRLSTTLLWWQKAWAFLALPARPGCFYYTSLLLLSAVLSTSSLYLPLTSFPKFTLLQHKVFPQSFGQKYGGPCIFTFFLEPQTVNLSFSTSGYSVFSKFSLWHFLFSEKHSFLSQMLVVLNMYT